MLHGNFIFLSFRECEIDTSNAVFSDGDGSVRKVKLETENYTAAIDILTYFLKLPLIYPVGISPTKTVPCMKQANSRTPSTANKNGAES